MEEFEQKAIMNVIGTWGPGGAMLEHIQSTYYNLEFQFQFGKFLFWTFERVILAKYLRLSGENFINMLWNDNFFKYEGKKSRSQQTAKLNSNIFECRYVYYEN